MALIKCKECGKEISDTVDACPHCGYKYKKTNEMTTKKVVKIIIIVAVIGLILFFGLTFLIFDFIPQFKVNNEMKKYYGEWELVDNDYDNAVKVGNAEYELKKNIVIDKNNIESQGDTRSCGFNKPSKGFAITTFKDLECSNEYYLITSLDDLAENTTTEYPLENILVCFDLKDNSLIQKTCAPNDNTTAKNVNLTYKLK